MTDASPEQPRLVTVMALSACGADLPVHGHAAPGPLRLREILVPLRHNQPLGLALRQLRKLRATLRGRWPVHAITQ